ncbi:MAG: hypothetical protein KKF50_01115 [Nanoarchaeota archaeon]|nr:hypothetical protein [Nanoarchaeota archaeon]
MAENERNNESNLRKITNIVITNGGGGAEKDVFIATSDGHYGVFNVTGGIPREQTNKITFRELSAEEYTNETQKCFSEDENVYFGSRKPESNS